MLFYKKPVDQSRATVKDLVDEAVFLSSGHRCDYFKAIECLQLAQIICKNLELSLPPESFSSETSNKIDSMLQRAEKISFFRVEELPSYPHYRNIEPDEGLLFYTKTLKMPHNLETLSFAELEAIISFNLGVCFSLLSDNQEGSEAMLYFNRAEALLLSQRQDLSVPTSRECPFELDHIAILHNQGSLHLRAGRYEDALKCYYAAVGKSVLAKGPEDLLVAIAFNCIGAVFSYQSSGDKLACKEAIGFFSRSLSILINIKARNDGSSVETLYSTVLNNIGRVNFIQNDFEKALLFHQEAHMARESFLGKYHFDTGVSAFNAGNCFHKLERSDLALKYYALFVQSAFHSKLGGEPILTKSIVMALESIATTFHHECFFDNARTFYLLTLSSARKVFGENDMYVARILNQLGNLYYECDQLEEALESYQHGLQIERETCPYNDGNIATTLSNIARIHEHNRNHQDALHFYQQSFDTLKESRNNSNAQRATALCWHIGRLQEKMGNLDVAISTFSTLLSFQKGDDCAKAIVLNRIGKLQMKKGFFNEALVAFQQSARLRYEEVSSLSFESSTSLSMTSARPQSEQHDRETFTRYNNSDIAKRMIEDGGEWYQPPEFLKALKEASEQEAISKMKYSDESKVPLEDFVTSPSIFCETGAFVDILQAISFLMSHVMRG